MQTFRIPAPVTKYLDALSERIPIQFKGTAYLRAFGLFKVPMLLFVSPKVEELTDDRCVIRLPLNYRTKNHWGTMYFGALAAGADCAGGLMAMHLIRQKGNQLSLIFKDFHAEFLKRPEGDVFFTCENGTEVRELVNRALESGEREESKVIVVATVPSKLGNEPVARFTLTLSLKRHKK